MLGCNGMVYVGSAVNFTERINQHIKSPNPKQIAVDTDIYHSELDYIDRGGTGSHPFDNFEVLLIQNYQESTFENYESKHIKTLMVCELILNKKYGTNPIKNITYNKQLG